MISERFDESLPVNLMFSPGPTGDELANQILSWIDQEKELLLLTMFSIRNFNSAKHQNTLIQSLTSAVGRGAMCIVTTDRKQKYFPLTIPLQKAGCLVFEAVNNVGPFNAMHVKNMVLLILKTVLSINFFAGFWHYEPEIDY